ncbi:metal-dependent hydrolase [Kocuria sp.]|uniref:metal-dependent hydrolase n=1 Tax=Kocuria sp. TaxID=1871328 RepID=UPI0026DBB3E3|nr:metal-dependent hydrolase [Kocuria sp.]MDO4919852.1 metal-dependent hydrolase [Kocuria sp.]
MMGPSHAACGAAAWVALTGTYTVHLADVSLPVGLGLMPVGNPGVLTGALICAGAALLPDLDHPGGTVARSLPPLSTWLARGIARISGGHRRGTHSLVGLLVVLVLAVLSQRASVPVGDALQWSAASSGAGADGAASPLPEAAASSLPGQVWPLAAVLSVLLIACAVKVLAFVPDRLAHANWVVGILLGAFVATHPPESPHWFVVAVALGWAVHMLGDLLTTQGIHLLWPLRPPLPLPASLYRRRSFVRLPVLGNAGSAREILLLVPVTVYALAGLFCAAIAWAGLTVSV